MKKYFYSKVISVILLQLALVFTSQASALAGNTPAELNSKLEKATDLEQQYKLLITLAEHGPDATPALQTVTKLLDSPEPMVKAAALNVFISAMQPYPAAVPKLLAIIKPFPATSTQDTLRGMAVAALTEVCQDPTVFDTLLKGADKRLEMTLATALADKPDLRSKLAVKPGWPLPEISGTNRSVIVNGDFENAENGQPNGWELLLKDGAAGSCRVDSRKHYSGEKSLFIQKTNGKGYLELRSKSMVTVPAKAFWTWRGFYQADTAPASSLLLFRLENEQGKVDSHDNIPRSGWGWQSQSFLLNAPEGEWRKRLLILRPANHDRQFRLVVRIYGNPCELWLDNLTFPSPAWKMHIASPVPESPRYSWEQASRILAKRKDSTAMLNKGSNGQIQLQINGKTVPPTIYFPWESELGDYDRFNKAGIKIHNVVLPINDSYGKFSSGKLENIGAGPAWTSAKDRNYNFKPLFNKMRDVIRKDPNGYIMLGFHITWPEDYVKVNPGTAWKDKNGHYAYGNSLYMYGFKPLSQIPASSICWPSPYSNKPFEDAADVIRAFTRELAKTDMAKTVIGCFVCGGHDGQFEVLRRDFGPNGLRAWRQWLRAKYQNDENLQNAWSNKNVSIAAAPVPVNNYEKTKNSSDSPVFYSPATEQADRDYSLFRQERIWHLKEFLINAIKAEFKKPLLGAVWLMGGFKSKYTRSFVQSKTLDIAIVQPTYQNRMPGMLSGASIPFESLKMHRKMLFKELDFRSWIRETYHNELGSMKIGTPMSIAAFKSVDRKEIGQMIAHGAGGWWYYDISGNAFNNPQIIDEIKRSAEIAQWVDQQPTTFRPQTAVVLSYSAPAAMRMKIWRFRNEANWFLQYQTYALKLSGIPFDTCFLEDIRNNPELQKYRMYIFLNTYEMNRDDINFINRNLKKNDNVLVWHFAPGYLNPDKKKYDLDQVHSLTGFKVKTSPQQKNYRIYANPTVKGLLPLQGLGDIFRSCFSVDADSNSMLTQRFVIDDPQATPLASYADDGTTAVAAKSMPEWSSIYVAALGGLSGELVHQLAVKHNLYTVCSPNIAQVEINGSFISISPMQNGTLELSLPRKCTVKDAFSDEELGRDITSLKLPVEAGVTRWLLMN